MDQRTRIVENQCAKHYGTAILARPPHHIEEPTTAPKSVATAAAKKPTTLEKFSGPPDLQPISSSDPRWK
ncbi:MAG: hypothetical protein V4486_00510 [Patescibacteria group bacterium]